MSLSITDCRRVPQSGDATDWELRDLLRAMERGDMGDYSFYARSCDLPADAITPQDRAWDLCLQALRRATA